MSRAGRTNRTRFRITPPRPGAGVFVFPTFDPPAGVRTDFRPGTAVPPARAVLAAAPVALAAAYALVLPLADLADATHRHEDLRRVLAGRPPEHKYSLIGPLFATPLQLIGERVGDPRATVWLFNRLLFVAGCAGFWWLLRPVLPPAARGRFVVALLLTSMVPHHLMHFGGEVFAAVLGSFGLAAAVLRRAWWGVPLAALGVANTPGAVGGLAAASLVLAARTRRLRFLLAAPAAAALVLLENFLRRGDPFATGYDADRGVATALPYSGRPEFGYPLFFGLLSLVLSFGKGLVFFVPALFLPLPRDGGRAEDADLRWVYRVWVGFVVGLVLVYARWWAWYGGWFWGPRFLLFACLPAALVVARRSADADRLGTRANLLTLAALALACWAGVNGAVFLQNGLGRFTDDDYALEHVVWYVPECSALWWPFTRPQSLAWVDVARLASGAAAFAYLSSPVWAALGRRVPGWVAAVRAAPRVRF